MKYDLNAIDRHVGGRLRQMRERQHVTQTALGQQAEVSFQQVQKYENGTNRISASKLFIFAQELGVSPGYFFEDMPHGK